MDYLAQQFDNAQGWNDASSSKDADYEAKYVKDAIVQITIKDPAKNVPIASNYQLVGAFGGHVVPKKVLPLDTTLHTTI